MSINVSMQPLRDESYSPRPSSSSGVIVILWWVFSTVIEQFWRDRDTLTSHFLHSHRAVLAWSWRSHPLQILRKVRQVRKPSRAVLEQSFLYITEQSWSDRVPEDITEQTWSDRVPKISPNSPGVIVYRWFRPDDSQQTVDSCQVVKGSEAKQKK